MSRIAFVVVLAALASPGCVVHRHRVVHHDPAPRTVVVEPDDERYWDGAAFVVVRGHRHGPGCGHYYHHGCWHLHPENHVYIVDGHRHYGVRASAVHVHSEHCGHAWDGVRWVYVRGHVHRPGCGHFYHHGGWHVHGASHVYVHKGHGHLGIHVRIR